MPNKVSISWAGPGEPVMAKTWGPKCKQDEEQKASFHNKQPKKQQVQIPKYKVATEKNDNSWTD